MTEMTEQKAKPGQEPEPQAAPQPQAVGETAPAGSAEPDARADAPTEHAASAEHPASEDDTDETPAFIPPAAPKTFPYDLAAAELDRAFYSARTPRAWTDRAIEEDTLQHLYDLVKLGPTSANSAPARFVFIRSQDGKERLRPALTAGNLEGVMKAPVTVIIAYDHSFYDFLPRLYPQADDARSWFAWNDEFTQETALRNSSLQGGYLILAARLLGLDCWPMSGFDNAKVDATFLSGRGWRSNFLLNIGYAEPVEGPRNPRLMFDEACEVV
jgi:3-hydroxypropanoate dehydrogenase